MQNQGSIWRCILTAFPFLATAYGVPAQAPSPGTASRLPVVAWVENRVEMLRARAQSWDPASTNTPYNHLNRGDQLRTLENSRAGLHMADYKGCYVVSERSLFVVRMEIAGSSFLEVIKGKLFHFHRGPPAEQQIRTPTVAAVIRGTEYAVEVDDDGTTTVSLFNGEVELHNSFGRLILQSGQQAVTEPGRAPRRTAVIIGRQIVQWCLYYPAVLCLDDLSKPTLNEPALAASLSAYRSGHLLAALAAYPAQRVPASAEEMVYRAALLLSVGNVEEASVTLNSPALSTTGDAPRLGAALRSMVATVRGSATTALVAAGPPGTATEALVDSYREQAGRNLVKALDSARRAAELRPGFAFAWVRVAELEFGFGRNREARAAMKRGLDLAPHNAQAVALEGFLYAGQNQIDRAVQSFNQAIALDGALGNAWLGRGLCRFRRGDMQGALEDLQMAAALEPQRALPRSYLAKVWGESGLDDLALRDVALAQSLDPADPTAWLYSGLIRQRLNEVNPAVEELERSFALNENRALFRSHQLLDEDLAVRSANLATVYQDAGLGERGRMAAAGAVTADYANYSAHLFLADSFNSLRDPRQISQRYETPWLSELLLANLLAPAAGGTLSRGVSQQEYSSLLARDDWQLRSAAQYSSHGDWWANGFAGANYRNVSVGLDFTRLSLDGYAPNTDTEQWSYNARMKFDCGPSDSLLVQVAGYENKSGDTRDYYNPAQASRTLRFQENQEPNVYAGWHHEWGPGSRTLFLAARLVDEVSQDDPAAGIPVIARSGSGTPTFGAVLTPFGQTYSSRLEGYSVEAQHILKTGRNTLIVGARFQDAEVHSSSRQYYDPLNFPPLFFGTANPALSFAGQRPDSALRRVNGYVYDTVEVAESFHLLGGLAYESVDSPANADLPPLSGGEQRVDQWSPKAGFAWRITEANDLRGMYARSLGGTYYESSIRLEPAQLLGFPQAYRSTIPESVVGPVPGTSMDIAALEWTHRSPTRTFVSVRAEGLWSDADRNVGSFDYFPPAAAAQLKQSLDYQEVSLTVAADQLIGAGGVVGIRYRVSEARLDESLTDLPASLPTDGSLSIRQNVKGLLQTLDLHAAYTHSQGWYVGANATLYAQDNDGYTPGLRGDTFWQCNLNAGWWLYRRKARLQLDLLNLTDQDYRLNPLNLHASLPRERTLVVSFKVSL